MVFDSLTYARRLKTAGFTEAQAEALADANPEMVVHDTATKDDITNLKTELKADIASLRTGLKGDIALVKADIALVKADLVTMEERLTLRLTVRFGVMLAASLSLMTAIVGALIKFH